MTCVAGGAVACVLVDPIFARGAVVARIRGTLVDVGCAITTCEFDWFVKDNKILNNRSRIYIYIYIYIYIQILNLELWCKEIFDLLGSLPTTDSTMTPHVLRADRRLVERLADLNNLRFSGLRWECPAQPKI